VQPEKFAIQTTMLAGDVGTVVTLEHAHNLDHLAFSTDHGGAGKVDQNGKTYV
jgi:hypothetical protein